MFKSFGKKEAYVLDAVGLIASILILAFAGYVLIGSSLKKKNSLEFQRYQYEQQSVYIDQLKTVLEVGYETLHQLQDSTGTRVSQKTLSFPEFYNALADRARENRVELNHVEPGTHKDANGYSHMDVRVSGSTSFVDFYSFLSDVEQMPQMVRIDNMNIRRGKDEKCAIEMTLRLFGQKDVVHGD
jgi:Tfp pilus assembly protein PilO